MPRRRGDDDDYDDYEEFTDDYETEETRDLQSQLMNTLDTSLSSNWLESWVR